LNILIRANKALHFNSNG